MKSNACSPLSIEELLVTFEFGTFRDLIQDGRA